MAVATSPEPLLKSTPDVNKLNAFNNPIVTVTRHKAARGTPGFSVVASLPMKAMDILGLQTTLPINYGPGYYKFTVADTAGGDSESWMVALGKPDEMEVSPMPGPAGPSMPPVPPVNAPLDPETKQIMPGWFYNESTGLLMTPWREAVQWRQGEALPKPPTPAASGPAPHLQVVPPNANPWSWPAPQSSWGGGWGGYPVNSGESDEVKMLKERLAAQDRQRELDQLREDQRRRDEEQKRREEERERREEERARQTTAMFEKLAAALTTKPAGPSPEELRLQREAEDSRRRAEEAERRHEEERREAQRREEARAAEDRHREEMRALKDAVAANKPDPMSPMIGMLTTLMTNMQASSAETVRTIKDTLAAGTASAERFMMSPAQVFDMVRNEKTGAAEMSQVVLATTKEMMGAQKEMYQNLLQIAGDSNQPAWVGLASEAMQKIGVIGQALAERNANAQPQYQPPPPRQVQRHAPARHQTVQVQQPVPQQQVPIAVPRQQVAAATRAREGYVDTGGRPEGTIFDPKTEEFILADGMRIKQSVVEKDGWVVAIKEAIRQRGMQQGQVQSTAIHAEPAPAAMNGAAPAVNGAAGPANVAPAPANKRKKKAAPASEPEPAPAAEVVPQMAPPADPSGYTLEEMRSAHPDAVLQAISAFDDPTLFGELWQYVQQLRQSKDPQQIVQVVMQGQAFLRSSGKTVPAMDLLAAEQLGPFVERLLPEAPQEFGQAVFDQLAAAMGLTDDAGDDA